MKKGIVKISLQDKLSAIQREIDKAELFEIDDREDYSFKLIKIINTLLDNKTLDAEFDRDLIAELEGRALNMYLRGYDIPLQGSTTHTCSHMRPVIPEPWFFERRSFLKLY
jgi:hypothetical protein